MPHFLKSAQVAIPTTEIKVNNKYAAENKFLINLESFSYDHIKVEIASAGCDLEMSQQRSIGSLPGRLENFQHDAFLIQQLPHPSSF